MPSPASRIDLATLRLENVNDGHAEFSVPGTEYRLDLQVEPGFEGEVGRRIRGVVRGTALRIHQARAGGNFIEPLQGRPRIVQGTVLAVDGETDEVIVDLVVPMRIRPVTDQPAAVFATGDVVNFYMEPGTRFATAEEA